MTSGDVIRLDGVGKRYWKLEEQAMLLRSFLPFTRPSRTEMWALRDLDVAVGQGETVGVLGRNGAGKTTLLRLLSGVTRPTTGTVRVVGRTAPLIGLGVGFQPEMSGRENVYVNGLLLGLTKAEVDERFEDIVGFAELADYIDTPVKFYSSGMFMRLGFSVAIHIEPQVLLVDEVLAVGDIAFVLKCLDRMRQLRRSGTTIVIVSHSMDAVRLLCPRALLLRKGGLEYDGDTETAIARHHEVLAADAREPGAGSDPHEMAWVGGATVLKRELVGTGARPSSAAPMRFRLRVRFDRPVESPQVVFHVVAEDGSLAYLIFSVVGRHYRTYEAGEEEEVEIRFVPRLGGGTYRLFANLAEVDGRVVLHHDAQGTYLHLPPRLGLGGVADLEASISVGGQRISDHEPPLIGDAPASAEGPASLDKD